MTRYDCDSTNKRFEKAGYSLNPVEALFITKLLVLMLEYAAPSDSAGHSGLAAGDTIDLIETPAANLVYAGGVRSVFDGAAAASALTVAGSYTAGEFALTSDGHGGNAITLAGDPA